MDEQMTSSVLGAVLVGIGVLLWVPSVRLPFARYRDAMYRRIPWLQRIPGARALYADAGQRIVIRLVGSTLVVFGLLLLLDVVEMR